MYTYVTDVLQTVTDVDVVLFYLAPCAVDDGGLVAMESLLDTSLVHLSSISKQAQSALLGTWATTTLTDIALAWHAMCNTQARLQK